MALTAGVHEVELEDHGPGFEHPDCVALSRDPKFDPSLAADVAPVLKDAAARCDAAFEALIQRTTPPPLPADAAACRAAQDGLRKLVSRSVGLEPLPERSPLQLKSVGILERGDYTLEKITFESRPGYLVPAHVYRPTGPGPFPAVVVPVGHWMVEGKMATPMQGLGQALARRGYVALIYDPVDEGERRVPGMSHRLALPLWLAGQCDLTYLLWDSMR